jgi:hypothetical protein
VSSRPHNLEVSSRQQNLEMSSRHHSLEVTSLHYNLEVRSRPHILEVSSRQHNLEVRSRHHSLEGISRYHNLEVSRGLYNPASTAGSRAFVQFLEMTIIYCCLWDSNAGPLIPKPILYADCAIKYGKQNPK